MDLGDLDNRYGAVLKLLDQEAPQQALDRLNRLVRESQQRPRSSGRGFALSTVLAASASTYAALSYAKMLKRTLS